MAEYRHVTEEEGQEIWAEANIWFDNAPARSNFNSSKVVARMAVAEFIANNRGLTLYKFAATR